MSTLPRAMATYYIGNPWFGLSTSSARVGRDQTFSLFGTGPIIYTAFVFIAERINLGYCSMGPVSYCEKPLQRDCATVIFGFTFSYFA